MQVFISGNALEVRDGFNNYEKLGGVIVPGTMVATLRKDDTVEYGFIVEYGERGGAWVTAESGTPTESSVWPLFFLGGLLLGVGVFLQGKIMGWW